MSSQNAVPSAESQTPSVMTNVQVPQGYGLVKLPEAKQRAKRVDDETFVKTYVTLAKQGKTTEEIAKELGMEEQSVISRASAKRKECSALNLNFPIAHRKKGGGRQKTRMTPDQLRQFLGSLNA